MYTRADRDDTGTKLEPRYIRSTYIHILMVTSTNLSLSLSLSISISVYIYIYMCIYIYVYNLYLPIVARLVVVLAAPDIAAPDLHDRNVYTTTNQCLQCLLKIMYPVF